MILIIKKIKPLVLFLLFAGMISCNDDLEQIVTTPVAPGQSLQTTLAAIADDSLYMKVVTRSGLTFHRDSNASYTMFVPNNAAMRQFVSFVTGGAIPAGAPDPTHSAFLLGAIPTAPFPVSSAVSLVNYHTIPQKLTTSAIVHPFPNMEMPTNFIAVPGNPLARLRAYISKNPSTGTFYFNNIPFSTPVDVTAGNNSMIHHITGLGLPPQRMIWERLNTDSNLTIFKAAIQRADSGYLPTTPGSLIGGFQNFGANFTVLAPTNNAMRDVIYQLTGGAVGYSNPNAVFIAVVNNPAIVTAQFARGIVTYHLSGTRVPPPQPPPAPQDSLIAGHRAFTVNIPTSPITSFTFLHNPGPGYNLGKITYQAAFTGPVATSATVKGAANTTASNFLINSFPDTTRSYGAAPPAVPLPYTGSSDQHYVNGVLQKIDQVLRPF